MGDVTTDWMMKNHNPAEDGLWESTRGTRQSDTI